MIRLVGWSLVISMVAGGLAIVLAFAGPSSKPLVRGLIMIAYFSWWFGIFSLPLVVIFWAITRFARRSA
jgi:hypothetical protein